MSGRKEVLGDGTDLQVPSSSEGVSSSSTGEDQKSANSVDRVDTSQEADQSFAQSVVPSRKRPFSGVVQPERRGKAIGLSPSAALSAQVGEIHDDDARSSSSNDADTQFRNKPPSSSDYDGKGPTPNSACALQHRWDSMFDRLLAFKAKHGHCLVPNRYDEDRSLGAWVSTQRRHYKAVESGHHHHESTPLTEERVTKLREIGFVWATSDPRHTPWNVRFEELRAYRERFGDALVPIGFKENMQLANWVSTQRQGYKAFQEGRPTRMTAEKIRLLESVGMVWDAQRGGHRQRGRYRPVNDSSTSAAVHAHSPSAGGANTFRAVTQGSHPAAPSSGKAPPNMSPQTGSNEPVPAQVSTPLSSSIVARDIDTFSASLLNIPTQQYNSPTFADLLRAAPRGTGSTIPDPALVAALIEANVRQYAMPPNQLDLMSAAGGFRNIPASMRGVQGALGTTASRPLALTRTNPLLISHLMAQPLHSSIVSSQLLMEQSLLERALNTQVSGSRLSSVGDMASSSLLSQYITNRLRTSAYSSGSLLYPPYANAGLTLGGYQGDMNMQGTQALSGPSLLQQARLAAAALSDQGAQMSTNETASYNMMMARRALE